MADRMLLPQFHKKPKPKLTREDRKKLFIQRAKKRERLEAKLTPCIVTGCNKFLPCSKHPQSRFMSKSIRQIGNSTRQAHTYKQREEIDSALQDWRLTVLTRDGFRCVWCGSTEQLEADHINEKSVYPDLKYDVNNGRTLCKPCHKKTPTYGRHKTSGIISIEPIHKGVAQRQQG